MKRLTFEVDKVGGRYQASICLLDEDGSGSGRRIYGPSYAGNSTPVLSVALDADDRAALRRYLDEVDQQGGEGRG